MYKELACYDSDYTEKDIIEAVFLAFGGAKKVLDGISIPEHFLAKANDLIPPDMVLACPIDFPKGFSSHQAKVHSIISSARKGANAVDITLNKNLCAQAELKKIGKNLSIYSEVCKDKKCSLRVMLEYRIYKYPDFVYDLCDMCVRHGVDRVFISTGHMVDDITDHLITCKIAEEITGVRVIYNADIWTKEQYEKILLSKVSGLRFKKPMSLKNIFGVL
jgi:deoxyribose-phosphate aldolase